LGGSSLNTIFRRSFATVCAVLMTAMIFQNVSAEGYNSGEDMDLFVDSFGNEHQVWRELVNGTYQVFYGYKVADTIYNTNQASYSNQSINNNINFDDGYIMIINCTINGNIKLTQANAILQDSSINGNVKIDLGRLQIINCSINGNLETKNADLEIRYSDLNGNLNVKQSSFDEIDSLVIANEINGNLKVKGGTCYIVGNTINGNMNVNDPAIIQQVIDNEVNGNTQLTNNTEGFDGHQITNSPLNVLYPQCTVDPITDMGYIFWLEYGVELYYVGTEDFITWSQPIFLGVLSVTGNPELDASAYNGNLMITWEYGGARTYKSDIDRDFIPDAEDTFPMEYNVISGDTSFIPDALAFDATLGISVAIDYFNNATVIPSITPIYMPPMEGSIGIYVNITTTCNQSFTAYVKCKYDVSQLPENIIEKYIRGYHYKNDSWLILKNNTRGEDTGIDMESNFFWLKVPDFSIFTFMDSSTYDSDHDGINDAEEINADGAPDARITSFSDGSTAKSLYFMPEETQTVSVKIPIYFAGIERVSTTNIEVTSSLYAYKQKHILTHPSNAMLPDIYQDKIVYMDDRNGNPDIYLLDTSTGEETQITDDPAYDGSPKIWGEYIFWYRSMNMLFLQDYITGEEWQIGYGGSGEIYNNYIVWPGAIYDIFTQTTKPLGGNGTPHIYGNYVAFIDTASNELRLYRISTESTIVINPVGSDPFLLDISERYVLYQDLVDNDLFIYDILSGITTQVTNNPYLEDEPTIYGNTAVWCDHRDENNWNIYGYDLVNGKEYPICSAQDRQEYPAIYEDTIIWSDLRNGVQWQLYSANKVTPEVSLSIDDQAAAETEIINGQCSIPDISLSINEYLKNHEDSDDGTTDEMITVPITISSNGAGTLDITSILIDLYIVDTDPLDEDTDDDGLWDGYNIAYNGLEYFGEKSYGSSPVTAHSDIDTLDDYTEAIIYGTNSVNPDTDNDGINDDVEIEYFLEILGEDVFWNNFIGEDMDGDSFNNGPFDIDTDGDGLSDIYEKTTIYSVTYSSKMVPFSVYQSTSGYYQMAAKIYNLKPYGQIHTAKCSYSWSMTGGMVDPREGYGIKFGFEGGTPITLPSNLHSGIINLLDYWNEQTISTNLNWYFRIYYKAIEDTHVTISTFSIAITGSSDPTLNDTDYDGLTDSDESIYATSPINHDTDFDQLADGYEVHEMSYTAPPLTFSKSGQFGGSGEGQQTSVIAVLFNVQGHETLDTVKSVFKVTDWGTVQPPVSLSLKYDGSSYYSISSTQNLIPIFGEEAFLTSHTWYLKATYTVRGDVPASFFFNIHMTFTAVHPDPTNPDSDYDGCIDSSDEFPMDPNESADTDHDNKGNNVDDDDDGDTFDDINDIWPLNPTGAVDSDYDGYPDTLLPMPWWWEPDYLNNLTEDFDDDNDGIPDTVEGDINTDEDGIVNRLDLDSDNDGIADAIESSPTPATPPDTDNDGTPDYLDLDSDNDDISDSTEKNIDVDSDGIPNYRDFDSDGDGVLDSDEGVGDIDGDGILNYLDADDINGPSGDSDGDGVPNSVEGVGDTDGDTIPDYLDPDDDGDGIDTSVEALLEDSDWDGTPDYLDPDDDGDSVSTSIELPLGDSDYDTIPDYLDPDDDGDGVPTILEDINGDGNPQNDNIDYPPASGTVPGYLPDDKPNYLDDDDDGDSILTKDEDINGDSNPTNDDTDIDGVPNYLDGDDDNDGWSTYNEITIYFITILTGDIDNDGILNGPLDKDSDGDGALDGSDCDPIIDLEITVKITQIQALDDIDGTNEADFYAWVFCDRAKFLSFPGYWPVSIKKDEPFKENDNYLLPSDLTNGEYQFNVPDDEELRLIIIYLFDDDGGIENSIQESLESSDDLCDISITNGGGTVSNSALYLNYNLKTGQWLGGDSPGDANGYRHTSGNEDGSTGTSGADDQDDSELWFDIIQNDYDEYGYIWWERMFNDNDNDGIPNYLDDDDDNDNIPDYWEMEYNFNPYISDSILDSDYDNLNNLQEYMYDLNPTVPNNRYAIIVGIDHYFWNPIPDTPGAEDGANKWKDYLLELGWDINNIYMYLGNDAQEETIKNKINDLKTVATENDLIVYIHFSHGDHYSKVGIPGYGTVIYCWDAIESGSFGVIQDTELYSAWSGYNGRLFLFIEACRSGGMDEVVTEGSYPLRLLTTACTYEGQAYSYDPDEAEGPIPAYAIWNKVFLTNGLQSGDSDHVDLEGNFQWAVPAYLQLKGYLGGGNNPEDTPQIFDGNPNELFYLWDSEV